MSKQKMSLFETARFAKMMKEIFQNKTFDYFLFCMVSLLMNGIFCSTNIVMQA